MGDKVICNHVGTCEDSNCPHYEEHEVGFTARPDTWCDYPTYCKQVKRYVQCEPVSD